MFVTSILFSDNRCVLQGLAGYPGGKGDEGPKGEDVSKMIHSLLVQACLGNLVTRLK